MGCRFDVCLTEKHLQAIDVKISSSYLGIAFCHVKFWTTSCKIFRKDEHYYIKYIIFFFFLQHTAPQYVVNMAYTFISILYCNDFKLQHKFMLYYNNHRNKTICTYVKCIVPFFNAVSSVSNLSIYNKELDHIHILKIMEPSIQFSTKYIEHNN